jgi:hypothetical protein
VLKLVYDVFQFLAPKHLLRSKTVVNKVLIQELLATSHSNCGVFGSGCLGHFLSNKTRDCIKCLLADAIRDRVVVHS